MPSEHMGTNNNEGYFKIKTTTRGKTFQWLFDPLLAFVIGVGFVMLYIFYYRIGIVNEDSTGFCFCLYGAVALFITSIQATLAIYGSYTITYEDQGEFMVPIFGYGNYLNWTRYNALCLKTNGIISYSQIERVGFLSSTSIFDGYGLGVNNCEKRVSFTTNRWVPAVMVKTTRKGCCFDGTYLLQVDNKKQGEELILKLTQKMSYHMPDPAAALVLV